MKTYKQFLIDAWIPPTKKSLRGGTESPLSLARKQGTDIDKVSKSVHRYAEPINDPRNPKYTYSKDSNGVVRVASKSHPIEVTFTPGDSPNTFIQNTTTTGPVSNRVGAGREMQRMKRDVSAAAKPETIIQSQPVGKRRASLNTNTQGMGPVDPESGYQGGIVRHLSPKQIQKKVPPLKPKE